MTCFVVAIVVNSFYTEMDMAMKPWVVKNAGLYFMGEEAHQSNGIGGLFFIYVPVCPGK